MALGEVRVHLWGWEGVKTKYPSQKRRKRPKKGQKLTLKSISQGVCKLAVDSRDGPKVHGTWVDVLPTSFGPSRTSGGVAKLENGQIMVKTAKLDSKVNI